MAMKSAIDFLNAFRMISQSDNYYGGRDSLKAENSNVLIINNPLDLHHL